MYNIIKNPITNRFVNINSKLGKKILQNYIILLGGSEIPLLEKEKSTISAITSTSEPFNYIFSNKLSEDSGFGYIFLNEDRTLLVKCVVINNKKKQNLKTFLGIYKETVNTHEFIKECNILKKMGEKSIGPKIIDFKIYNRIEFMQMIGDNNKIFNLENKSNLLEDKYIDDSGKVCDNNLEFGIIKMEFLEGYESLNIQKLMSSIELCENLNSKIDDMHSENVLHCDLHSGNILLSKDDSDIRIIDFGKSIIREDTPGIHRIEKEKFCKNIYSYVSEPKMLEICKDVS